MYIKLFRLKGGFGRTPSNPPAYGPAAQTQHNLRNYTSLVSTNSNFQERSSVGAPPPNTSTLYNYWKVIPQFVPLISFHADIFFNGSLYVQKIKMRVTCTYIEYATWKRYYSTELAENFILKQRYWSFAKITARDLWKKFWTSGITTLNGCIVPHRGKHQFSVINDGEYLNQFWGIVVCSGLKEKNCAFATAHLCVHGRSFN